MAEQARVTSLDALSAFRARLIVFLEKAQLSVDEMADEVRRTRAWVQQEQRPFWEREIRRRQQLLDLAEQELMSARLSSLRENIFRQKEAVRRGRQAVAEAEEKLRLVKKWTREFDHATEPLMRHLQGLRDLLESEMPKGLAFLIHAQRALDAYADVIAPNQRLTTSAPEFPATPSAHESTP